ncbi:MAG: hypothetical protein M0R21_08705 [Lentimicrobiaceae bacterium]|jgi:ribosome biogenesis SPOUT family RNA methylase Rps3|nr:hypothetical protein [Lentimicrobiaceae bacterium]
MKETRIIGLLITDRIKEAGQTQVLLTQYAHVIQSRLGFHELSENTCSRTGIIILHLGGNAEECVRFEKALSEVRGIEVQKMVFNH